jgi:tRNA G10  N-methylase Trm11
MLASPLITISASPQVEPGGLLNLLGGSVKIAEPVATATTQNELLTALSCYLSTTNIEAWALSTLPHTIPGNDLGFELKQQLKQTHQPFRYRLLRDIRESSGVLDQYQELIIVHHDQSWLVLRTVAVQNLSRWSQKDYDRPAVDPHAGMLPPKIARSLVNCAVPGKLTKDSTIYDPFCGSGTILAEALDLGASALGSDINAQAVNHAQQNCDWIKQTFNLPGACHFWIQDVLALNSQAISQPIEAIVFEGYLGPPHLLPAKIPDYHRGLGKLYTGALKRLLPLLTSGKRLVCALPQYEYQGHVKNYDSLIDSCEKYGYTQLIAPITYGRPHAIIKRSIYVLEKSI